MSGFILGPCLQLDPGWELFEDGDMKSFFKVFDDAASWDEAQRICRDWHGDLSTIHTQAEQDFNVQLLYVYHIITASMKKKVFVFIC